MHLLLASVPTGAGSDTPLPGAPGLEPLGRSEAQLRDEFGAALRAVKIEARFRHGQLMPTPRAIPGDSKATTPAAAAKRDPFADQLLLARESADADVRRVEYTLFRGKIYRVRWQLAERFERPLIDSFVDRLSVEFGKPYYDQQIEGKFGTGQATLRRTAWRRGPYSFEVRQLNPMVGGPIYLTRSDQAAIHAIVVSSGTAAPEPDSIGTWWQQPLNISEPLSAKERDALLAALRRVVDRVGWGVDPAEGDSQIPE